MNRRMIIASLITITLIGLVFLVAQAPRPDPLVSPLALQSPAQTPLPNVTPRSFLPVIPCAECVTARPTLPGATATVTPTITPTPRETPKAQR